ncbi:subtilisin-like protease SBT3 [Quercus robur]|uniref:subtilisin-like protease SBT3 n=1 Tax=Quercus robur TaxID=38942 RepID=UPI0021622EA3|nr:subtilisin-like protease SBT3 [Quercus robur]
MDKFLMTKAFSRHHYWYSSIIDSFKFTNLESPHTSLSSPLLLYTNDNAHHGFGAVLSLDELETLNKSLGFISACADKPFKLATSYSPEFLSLKASTGLWPASNYGKDIIIGVIDSGIWPEHPSFEDHGRPAGKVSSKWKVKCEGGQQFNSSMCNSKLIGVRYFNAALKRKFRSSIVDSARDTTGHGTYASSVVAGNFLTWSSFDGYAEGTTKGVAPYARISMYKVVWDGGIRCYVVAGMDQAIADGVDVICIAMGYKQTTEKLSLEPIVKASFSATEKGIPVTTAAGNTGPHLGSLSNGCHGS